MDIFDYLEWRGDLRFEQAPFCEPDALIFAWLAYFPLEKLRAGKPYPGEFTLKEMAETYRNYIAQCRKADAFSDLNATHTSALLLDAAVRRERFAGVRVLDYSSIFSTENDTQFSACVFEIRPGFAVISYRGTDTSVAGWKEDFLLSCVNQIPSQRLAADYLSLWGKDESRFQRLILCGHSKGGNLAMYAALTCADGIRVRLDKIYNFDGPGFSRPLESFPAYDHLKKDIVTILPEASIIGLLMEHEKDYIIVESDKSGIQQHNALLWHVKGDSLVRTDRFTGPSTFIDRTIKSWLAGLTGSQRKDFIEVVFDAILRSGISDFSHFEVVSLPRIINLVWDATSLELESRRNLSRVLLGIMQASGLSVLTTVKQSGLLAKDALLGLFTND